MVECLTDNRNRTASDVRSAFSKGGGNLGASGSVSYMFETKGIFTVPKGFGDEEEIMMAALEAGAEDVVDDDGLERENIKISVSISVTGEEIKFDFDGTDPQVEGNNNVTMAGLQASCLYCL